jgi:uncharacterized protein (DUF427 family)
MQATGSDGTVAESNETVVVERNHCFPVCSIHREYFAESETLSNKGP